MGNSTLLFVYGSLRRGQPQHGRMHRSSFEGARLTAPAFTLYALDTYPGLVRGGHTAVHGELFRVEASTLTSLDVYEDHPLLFRRESLHFPDGLVAEAYLLRPDQVRKARPIPGGDWATHLRHGRR